MTTFAELFRTEVDRRHAESVKMNQQAADEAWWALMREACNQLDRADRLRANLETLADVCDEYAAQFRPIPRR